MTIVQSFLLLPVCTRYWYRIYSLHFLLYTVLDRRFYSCGRLDDSSVPAHNHESYKHKVGLPLFACSQIPELV
ncbi:hypothetical protein MPTK1_4g15530 [Marchantia polymorpha subsp. ruderalis]|uniref:Uncharacterized protein n=2 Tax=Marchantia polymorpha TaxID=3197 RepID=A0AAF6BA81_MARPO|nr:hypothetical protein MARPO_0054s0018 [Marchantia polymorpha]BBN08915.1 hypothetical protein Mp_4g15530 [Marchantia polymorpha subsp. ruderalis]|eukprot:PTQ37901.1 hypothetical protein MARPO_0054s0018 [Marchantia polymorpha]